MDPELELSIKIPSKKLIKLPDNTKECREILCSNVTETQFRCFKCNISICMSCFSKKCVEGKGIQTCSFCGFSSGVKTESSLAIALTLYVNIINLFRKHFPSNYVELNIPITVLTFYDRNKQRYVFESYGLYHSIDGRMSNECVKGDDNLNEFLLKLFEDAKEDKNYALIDNMNLLGLDKLQFIDELERKFNLICG